jgi:uncharacterized integral membrane protein
MKVLLWFLRGILFVVLLGLAIKNGSDVELRFYFGARWQVPLSIVVLSSLVAGVVLGLLALLPLLFRQRRSLAGQQRQLDAAGRTGVDQTLPDRVIR